MDNGLHLVLFRSNVCNAVHPALTPSDKTLVGEDRVSHTFPEFRNYCVCGRYLGPRLHTL